MKFRNVTFVVAGFMTAASSIGCPGDADLQSEIEQLRERSDAGKTEMKADSKASACEDMDGTACDVGRGSCLRKGEHRCIDGKLFCNGTPGQPSQELCETKLDEDCDGATDEAPPGGCCTGADCALGEVCRLTAADALLGGECLPESLASSNSGSAENEDGDAAVEEGAAFSSAPEPEPEPEPEPVCGNGRLEPGEACEAGAGGESAFSCSAGCEPRTVYSACANTGPDPVRSSECNENDAGQVCAPLSPSALCLPLAAGIADCPALPAEFTQAAVQVFGRGLCVITCQNDAGCPAHLGLCWPLVTEGDYQMLGVCMPSVP